MQNPREKTFNMILISTTIYFQNGLMYLSFQKVKCWIWQSTSINIWLVKNAMFFVVVSKNNLQESIKGKTVKQTKAECNFSVIWEPVINEAANQVYFWILPDKVKDLPRILKSVGMKLTAAPIAIKKHFDNVSINIPEVTPENVFEYYTLHSHQACCSGKFPCMVTKSKFRDVDSFKTFIKFVTSGHDSVIKGTVQNEISSSRKHQNYCKLS